VVWLDGWCGGGAVGVAWTRADDLPCSWDQVIRRVSASERGQLSRATQVGGCNTVGVPGPINALLTEAEREAAAAELSGWSFGQRLHRYFEFDDFPSALAFMVHVGFEAERLCHHPNWSNVYNRVEVELWSHDLGGVSRLCVDLAKAMDRIAR